LDVHEPFLLWAGQHLDFFTGHHSTLKAAAEPRSKSGNTDWARKVEAIGRHGQHYLCDFEAEWPKTGVFVT
jgi:hypothetical protein